VSDILRGFFVEKLMIETTGRKTKNLAQAGMESLADTGVVEVNKIEDVL
jgi:hypothetical protein